MARMGSMESRRAHHHPTSHRAARRIRQVYPSSSQVVIDYSPILERSRGLDVCRRRSLVQRPSQDPPTPHSHPGGREYNTMHSSHRRAAGVRSISVGVQPTSLDAFCRVTQIPRPPHQRLPRVRLRPRPHLQGSHTAHRRIGRGSHDRKREYMSAADPQELRSTDTCF